MFSIINRYLSREISLTFLATVMVLLGIVLSHRLANYLSQAANGLLARDSILLLVALQIVPLLGVLIPLAFLLSIMLTLGRLYRDNEMTALAACGYGPLSVYRAILLLAVPLTLVTVGLSFFLTPIIMELQFEAMAKARKEAEISMFTPGAFREVLQGRHIVYVSALDEHELRNVFIQTLEPDGDISITTGDHGRSEIDEKGTRHIVLDHGYRYRGVPGQGDYEILRFEKATMPVDTKPPQSLQRQETLPNRQLWRSTEPSDIAELHMRFNSPISVLIIALWAPLLARARPHEGRYGRIVAAILIYAINFNLVGLGQSWLSHGVVGTTVGLWWVHGLFLLFSLGLLLHYYSNLWNFRLFGRTTWRTRAA
ncbi:MAG: LPS export ABC transporter permease LptF [Candidatus Competibacteraceae bacterium]